MRGVLAWLVVVWPAAAGIAPAGQAGQLGGERMGRNIWVGGGKTRGLRTEKEREGPKDLLVVAGMLRRG